MKPTILIYDSGMGGLTIYDEVRKALPNAHYLYCFDNEYFPYSEKSEDVLIKRSIDIIQKIAEKKSIDLVVIACNTASTVVLPALRSCFSFPIVGTVPAIKPAAEISVSKTIGLLATKGTVVRPYVLKLVEQYAKECTVEKIGTTELVEIVEEKLQTGDVDLKRLNKIIESWQTHPTLDTVILGCTHFPAVKEELQLLLPNVKYFVDSGSAIAKRVVSLLTNFEKRDSKEINENVAYCTKLSNNFLEREFVMQKWGFKTLEVLNFSKKEFI